MRRLVLAGALADPVDGAVLLFGATRLRSRRGLPEPILM